jgi:hypothetical protein
MQNDRNESIVIKHPVTREAFYLTNEAYSELVKSSKNWQKAIENAIDASDILGLDHPIPLKEVHLELKLNTSKDSK